jgi:hypothetical protein
MTWDIAFCQGLDPLWHLLGFAPSCRSRDTSSHLFCSHYCIVQQNPSPEMISSWSRVQYQYRPVVAARYKVSKNSANSVSETILLLPILSMNVNAQFTWFGLASTWKLQRSSWSLERLPVGTPICSFRNLLPIFFNLKKVSHSSIGIRDFHGWLAKEF